MIPLADDVAYGKNRSLDLAVTRFVNDNLITIFDMLYEIELENEEKENVFSLVPSGCYRDNTFSYIRKLQEIRAILVDNVLRKGKFALTPLNEYIIYKSIETYIEICESTGMDTTIEVPPDLKAAINACDEYWGDDESEGADVDAHYNVVLHDISDYRNYLELLFWDWDFLERCATAFVVRQLENPDDIHNEYSLEKLGEFSPMIPDDIYDKFRKEMVENMNQRNKNTSISVNGDHAIINTGSIRDIKSESIQPDISSNRREKKSFYEKYGMGTIIAALIGLIGVILGILFNS